MRRFLLLVCIVFSSSTCLLASGNEKQSFEEYKASLEQTSAQKLELEKMLSGVFELAASMVAKKNPNLYEIKHYGQVALLETRETVFSSPGFFLLMVRKKGIQKITTTGGWEQDWVVFEEISQSDKDKISTLKELVKKEAGLQDALSRCQFIRDSDGIITDLKTGKQWKEGPDKPLAWYEAQTWIKSLGDGWRTPTNSELMELKTKTWRDGAKLEDGRTDALYLDPAFHVDGAYYVWGEQFSSTHARVMLFNQSSKIQGTQEFDNKKDIFNKDKYRALAVRDK